MEIRITKLALLLEKKNLSVFDHFMGLALKNVKQFDQLNRNNKLHIYYLFIQLFIYLIYPQI